MTTAWRRHRSWLWPTLFLAPGVVLFGTVIVWSSLQSLWLGFYDWDGVGPKTWVGLGNYRELFGGNCSPPLAGMAVGGGWTASRILVDVALWM